MGKKLNTRNYITIFGWMITDLHLKGNELLVYALIYGFCQDGESEFTGSVAYVMAWSGLSYQGAANVLKGLVKKGLLGKTATLVNGVTFCRYRTLDPPKKFGTPSQKSLDNIDSNNNSPNGENISITPISPFNFRNALRGLGVEDEVVDAWLQVRKNKKATNTKIAFDAIAKEVALAGQQGHPATECIRLAVEKSWAGFKWEWMENDLASRSSRSARPAPGTERNTRRGSAVDRMLDMGAEMFGPKPFGYNEQ